MRAEILSIGSELTSGQNLDTNSQWLSRKLAEFGISVAWHTTVADDLEINVEAFSIASRRADLILSTGGLGPTQDDLTREVLAKVAGVDLVFHEESFQAIQEMFARRRRMMTERNRSQALFPVGAEPLPNDRGTAPGIWMGLNKALVAAMPGVPSEMFAMFENQVLPRLRALGLAGDIMIQRKINCFGAGESVVEEKLLDLTRRGHVPEVGITVSDAVVSLRILARAPNTTAAQVLIEPVERTIRERLGEWVFGADSDELEDAVVGLLESKRRTLATAEGVTAGLVAVRLGRVPGASAWFRGGVVAYDNTAKTQLLGVPRDLIYDHGTVSAKVAESMAEGCRTRLGVDLAVSTVGLAGPDGKMPDKPIGLVFAAIAWADGVRSASFNWHGTRGEIQSRTAKLALNLARLHLMKT